MIIDVSRIIAISLVVAGHIAQVLESPLGGYFGAKDVYYVSIGGFAVTIFVILSGILAGISARKDRIVIPEYLLRRIIRIYPVYWISTLISLPAYFAKHYFLYKEIPLLFPNGLLIDLFGIFTGFYSWIGLWGGPYNSPAWFIGLIMTMYLLFPVILFFMKKNKWLTLAVLFLLSLASRVVIGKYGLLLNRPLDWFPLCRIFEFGLGVFLSLTINEKFWFELKVTKNDIVVLLSNMSFPLFLVHHPYVLTIRYLVKNGIHPFIAISCYLICVLLLSYFTLRIVNIPDRKNRFKSYIIKTG